jgi:hypothetical protein
MIGAGHQMGGDHFFPAFVYGILSVDIDQIVDAVILFHLLTHNSFLPIFFGLIQCFVLRATARVVKGILSHFPQPGKSPRPVFSSETSLLAKNAVSSTETAF